ncbi:MAG: hypothetical protein F4154_04180, partial [Candidatus Dadabacteria bacterium]|nr:hypothetical protein [Candidatus Dadabacteria bacterium]
MAFGKLHRPDSSSEGKDSMVGVDIGSNSVKVVEFAYEGGNYRLENIGEAMLPSGAITGKSVSKGDVVSAVISNLVSKLGIKARRVAIGLSGEAVALKIVSVPKTLLRNDMEKLVPDLVSTSLRRNVGGVNYSYTPLFRRNGKSAEVPVLI